MAFFRPVSKTIAILVVGALAVSVGGCGGGQSLSKLNPFKKEEKRLEGERVPVFPEGHQFRREPNFKRVGQDGPASPCRDDDAECKAKAASQQ